VDYIGQLEDDLADMIKARARPGQKVVMIGHSSGGGLVTRFAGGANGGLLDGAVLLAPFLKYNAPTTRPNSGGWAMPQTRRIIGLSILNAVGIRALNYLVVISFKMPDAVMDGPLGHLATTSYSFRMNASYAPRVDYLSDIKALPPFPLMAGDRDEAFIADQYEPLMRQVTGKGRYLIAKDTGHLGIVDAPGTAPAILAFLNAL
jgi:pimeloyl-ACP methyl ester carboxylesterase